MPFSALCCLSCHDEWRHGVVESKHLRQCIHEEAIIFKFTSEDPKNNERPLLAECATHGQNWFSKEYTQLSISDQADSQNLGSYTGIFHCGFMHVPRQQEFENNYLLA